MQSLVHIIEVTNPDFLVVLKVGPEQWPVMMHQELNCTRFFKKKSQAIGLQLHLGT